MKIYHTETQADYDALMVELEVEGCVCWATGRKMTESKDWTDRKENTCVSISNKRATRGSIIFFKVEYPHVPITKYTAKVDEKMKFTKENVVKVIDDYFLQADFEPCGDLIAAIDALDDTPEKVVVPKFIAVYLDKAKGDISLMRVFEIANGYLEYDCFKNEYNWIRKNSETFARAWLSPYDVEVEKEQLYCIPLPHLETAGGTKQVLSQRENRMNYFASTPHKILKQRFTKEELEQVPEIYRLFAKPIEEE